VETAGSGKPILADALRVRAYGRDLIRAKGIVAGGACEGHIEGRTHGRTNQQTVAAPTNHLPTESRPHTASFDVPFSARMRHSGAGRGFPKAVIRSESYIGKWPRNDLSSNGMERVARQPIASLIKHDFARSTSEVFTRSALPGSFSANTQK
jgi:hypothetical protein